MQSAVVIVLADNQRRGAHAVHPCGHICHIVIRALAGHCVHQHRTHNVLAAEQTDGFRHHRGNPPRVTVFINFKFHVREHFRRILKTQMTHGVPEEIFRGRVPNSVFQPLHRHFLGYHVDDNIRRNALRYVVQPLKRVSVIQIRHTHRRVLIIDLRCNVRHFKLANQIRQLAQFSVCQHLRGVAVQHGNLLEGNLFDIRCEITGFHFQ